MKMIFAHRGFSGYYPENTMLAFEKAASDTHADGIELDIQMTKDGELVIMHDETLDRTTNGSGFLKDYTYKELRQLSVGVNFKGFLPRQSIASVEEYCEFIKGTSLITNIELKTSVFEYEGIEAKLLAIVDRYNLQDKVWFSSFNHYTLQRLQRLRPNIKCGLLMDTWLVNAAQYASSCNAATINACSAFCCKPGFPQELHKVGIGLQAWTPNTAELMRELWENGTDVLITNYPDIAYKVLQEFAE